MTSGIYEQRWFEVAEVAEAWLAFTGYRRYDDDQNAWSFLVPPGGPFELNKSMTLKESPRSMVKHLMSEGLMPMQWSPRFEEYRTSVARTKGHNATYRDSELCSDSYGEQWESGSLS